MVDGVVGRVCVICWGYEYGGLRKVLGERERGIDLERESIYVWR